MILKKVEDKATTLRQNTVNFVNLGMACQPQKLCVKLLRTVLPKRHPSSRNDGSFEVHNYAEIGSFSWMEKLDIGSEVIRQRRESKHLALRIRVTVDIRGQKTQRSKVICSIIDWDTKEMTTLKKMKKGCIL